MLPRRETIISCGRCTTNGCLSTWSERFILYGSCLRRRQRENTQSLLVFTVQCSGCCQGSCQSEEHHYSDPEHFFNISWAHWSVLEWRLLAQLDANRYTVNTTDINISIVTFPLLCAVMKPCNRRLITTCFSLISVFTCLRVGAISSAAVWRWVREWAVFRVSGKLADKLSRSFAYVFFSYSENKCSNVCFLFLR